MLSASHSFGVNFDDEEDDVYAGSQAEAAPPGAGDDEDDELLKLCMMAEQDTSALPLTSSVPARRAEVAPPSRQPPRPTAMVMEEAFPTQARATDQNTLRELHQLFSDAQRAPAASSFAAATDAKAFRPTVNFADIPVIAGSLPTGKESLKRTYGVVLNSTTENVVPQPASSAGFYRDKWSGFRLKTVVTSPLLLDQHMEHRRPLRVSSLEREIKGDGVPYDFVLFGIVVNGGLTKLTAKNEKYITWRVSDMKSGSVTVCLFKKAYEKHKLIGEGSVVAILNPSVWKADKKCPAVSCSYDTQILCVGICPDLGVCKGSTRTGDPCGVNINLEHGPVCDFHLQQQLHAVRAKSAVLNNRNVAGASSNRLFVPGSGVVLNQPAGFNKAGPRVPMEVMYTPQMNAVQPGRVSITATSTVSLDTFNHFASFAPPPPVTNTWKPSTSSSPSIRKIHETISAKATESAAKTAQKPAIRPNSAQLSSPVAQPVFSSSDVGDDDGLIVLDDPAAAPHSSIGNKRVLPQHEKSSNASKKAGTGSTVNIVAPAVTPKQPSLSQQPRAMVPPTNSAPSVLKPSQSQVNVAKDMKASALAPRPAGIKLVPSQPSSTLAAKNAHLSSSTVAALQAKIQSAAKSEIFSSTQTVGSLPGGGPIHAPSRKDTSQLLNSAQRFGVDVEAVKSQHSAHEDIADQSIREREQRKSDLLLEAAKLEEKQMGILETKVSVWSCTQCSYLGYKYCPMHEDKAHNKRMDVIQRYFKCANCQNRITWLRGPFCSATCSKCNCSQWKQCAQYKGKVGSSEDEWKKANTPSEFSLYHQR